MRFPLLLLLAAEVTGFNFTPVQKLLQMLRQMEVKCVEEKQMAEGAHAKLKILCDDAPKKPSELIAEVDRKIAQVEADIVKAESDLVVLARDIAFLEAESVRLAGEVRNGSELSTTHPQSIRALAETMHASDRVLSDKQVEDAKVAKQTYMQQLTDDLLRDAYVLAGLEALRARRLEDMAMAEGATGTIPAEDHTALADFRTRCDAKSQDYVANQAVRSAELVAIKKAIEHISSIMTSGVDDRYSLGLQKAGATPVCSAQRSELAGREVERIKADDLELVPRLVNETDDLELVPRLVNEIADMGLAIAQLQKAMAQASERRLEEKENSALLINAAKGSRAAVQAAIEVLSEFYRDPLGAASLQGMDQFAARETVKATVHRIESGDIIRMSSLILSDFSLHQAEAEEIEDRADMTHITFMNESNDDLAAKTMNMKYLDLQVTMKMKQLKVQANNNLELAQKKLEAELKYLDALEEAWERLDATRHHASNFLND